MQLQLLSGLKPLNLGCTTSPASALYPNAAFASFNGSSAFAVTSEVQASPSITVTPQSTINASATADVISRVEFFKLLVDIDRQLLRTAAIRGTQFKGLSGSEELSQLDRALTAVLNTDVTEQDITDEMESILNAKLNGIPQLSGLFKKAAEKVGNVLHKVADTVKKVVKKAIEVVHKVVTLPLRGLVTAALSMFKGGKVAKMFIYAFIPDGSPVLQSNPEVARKSARQKNFIKLLSKAGAFPEGYLLKHIRNNVEKSYKKTPEEVIQDLISKKDGDFKGLGIVGAAATISAFVAAITPIISFVPALISAFKPKQDHPASEDIISPPAPGTNVTGEPGQESNPSAFKEFITSRAGIVTSIVVVGGTAAAVVYVNKKKKNKK